MNLPRISSLNFLEKYNHIKRRIPSFNLSGLKTRIPRFSYFPKKVIIISAVVSFCLTLAIAWSLRMRNDFIAGLKTADKIVPIDTYNSPTSAVYLGDLSGGELNTLGASDSAETDDGADTYYTYPTPSPIVYVSATPYPTTPPLPTLVAYSAPTPTSVPDCSGIPTAYNSQAIVSTISSKVNSPVTIEIQLLDCHNSFAPVSDNLTVALVNSDGTARINGANSPVYIKAQNGKATVTVNSQINISDTFVITDTTRQFNVTDPRNRNPSVTFINNSSGNSNCTTAAGVANPWYSDVYPASLQSSTVGTAVTFNVVIRDCDKNAVSSNESLNITLASGSTSTTVNGNGLPYSLTAAGGQVNLSVNSQNAGTVTLIIHDTTGSFNITDPNSHNPSVNFTAASSPTSTPVPTSAQSNNTPTPSQVPTQASIPTPTTQTQPTPTASPTPITNTTLHTIPS